MRHELKNERFSVVIEKDGDNFNLKVEGNTDKLSKKDVLQIQQLLKLARTHP